MGCLKLDYCFFEKGAQWKSEPGKKNVQWFISPDPLQHKFPNISSFAYCNNNPVNYIDPDGCEVKNSYEAERTIAREKVERSQAALDAFGGDKKADGYKEAKDELKAAKGVLKTAETNYKSVASAIKDLKTFNENLYNSLNSLTDQKGRTVDVYIRLNANLSAEGREGQVIERYRTSDERFYNLSEVMTASGVVIELDPKIPVSDLGRVLAHEGGHAVYDVQNAKEHFQWLRDNGLNYEGYNGHYESPLGNDPSGEAAKEQERIYNANRRANPTGR